MTQQAEQSSTTSLLSSSLPPRPKILMAINQEVQKDNVNFGSVARLISEDVSISSAVLKIVNSPAFRRPTAIGSIDQALNLLGLKRVIAIVNTVAIRNAIKSKYNLEEFWEFGTIVGNVGLMFAQQCKQLTLMDDAYTLGLFHDACSSFLMNLHADYYDFFTQANNEGWILSIAEEEKKYGTTHNILGALMAQIWNLPEHIVMAIYHLHNSNQALANSDDSDKSMMLLSILKCAREIARFHQFNKPNNPEWLHCKTLVLEYLGLDDVDFIEMQNAIVEKMDGIA